VTTGQTGQTGQAGQTGQPGQAGRARQAGQAGQAPAPAQLPPDTTDFTGRSAQVSLLCGLLEAEPTAGRPGAVVISAVAGMGGIGKTALAVHVAHRLRRRFSGGQLYVNLQGVTDPLHPAEVLAGFLRDLGVPDAVIPEAEAERAARYRTLLAARRVLVVLDDARDVAQVRPLLPGSAGCAVIVTSRAALPDLAGAMVLELEVLDPGEARELFATIAGPGRAAAEPEATARVLTCCAGLPLAVRIAASRLASRPGWSVAHLAALLGGERDRLTELAVGDLAVRASFAVSYDALPAAAPGGALDPARVFRLLGLADAVVLSLPAVAALAATTQAEAAAALEVLADAHLVEVPAPEQYRLHDLLRGYAAELAGQADGARDRDEAVGRMLGWYGEQAVRAARAMVQRWPDSPLFAVAGPDMPGPAGVAWFEGELAGLAAAVAQASGLGRHGIAAQIATAMRAFLARSAHLDYWVTISAQGVASARHLEDDAILSSLVHGLGQANSRLGRYEEAQACFTEALDIRRRSGDRTGEATVLDSLGNTLQFQGRYKEALDCQRSSLAIYREVSERRLVGVSLHNTGATLLYLKRHGEALDHFLRALAIARDGGQRYQEGVIEAAIGETCLILGRYEESVEHYRRSSAALQETVRDTFSNADTLYGLGAALAALGRNDEAREAWHAARPLLDRLDEAGDPRAADLRQRIDDAGPADGIACASRGIRGIRGIRAGGGSGGGTS
jgi:tetratricopeptide (TPR) repeat protein